MLQSAVAGTYGNSFPRIMIFTGKSRKQSRNIFCPIPQLPSGKAQYRHSDRRSRPVDNIIFRFCDYLFLWMFSTQYEPLFGNLLLNTSFQTNVDISNCGKIYVRSLLACKRDDLSTPINLFDNKFLSVELRYPFRGAQFGEISISLQGVSA